jgi:hypothetical protein
MSSKAGCRRAQILRPRRKVHLLCRIEDVIAAAEGRRAHVMILDHDRPAERGRSHAAAFGALAVIHTERNAAPESGCRQGRLRGAGT